MRKPDQVLTVKFQFACADARDQFEFLDTVGSLFADRGQGFIVQDDVGRYALFLRQLFAMQS